MMRWAAGVQLLVVLCFTIFLKCSGVDSGLPGREGDDGTPPAPPKRNSGDSTPQLNQIILPESVADLAETELYIRSKEGKTSFNCIKETSGDNLGKFLCKAVP